MKTKETGGKVSQFSSVPFLVPTKGRGGATRRGCCPDADTILDKGEVGNAVTLGVEDVDLEIREYIEAGKGLFRVWVFTSFLQN